MLSNFVNTAGPVQPPDRLCCPWRSLYFWRDRFAVGRLPHVYGYGQPYRTIWGSGHDNVPCDRNPDHRLDYTCIWWCDKFGSGGLRIGTPLAVSCLLTHQIDFVTFSGGHLAVGGVVTITTEPVILSTASTSTVFDVVTTHATTTETCTTTVTTHVVGDCTKTVTVDETFTRTVKTPFSFH